MMVDITIEEDQQAREDQITSYNRSVMAYERDQAQTRSDVVLTDMERVTEKLSQAEAQPHTALDRLANGAVYDFGDVVYRAEGGKIIETEVDGDTRSFDMAEVREAMTDSLVELRTQIDAGFALESAGEVSDDQFVETRSKLVEYLRDGPADTYEHEHSILGEVHTYSLQDDGLHVLMESHGFRGQVLLDSETFQEKELPRAEAAQERSTSWTAVYDAAPETPAQAAAANAAKAIAASKERQVSQPAIQAKEASL